MKVIEKKTETRLNPLIDEKGLREADEKTRNGYWESDGEIHDENITERNPIQEVTPRTFDELRTAGEAFFPGLGAWSYDKWADLNESYYFGKLKPGPILWGLTPHGHRLGSCSHDGNCTITLHTSLFGSRTDAWGRGSLLGKRFAADVLVHEMLHKFLIQSEKSSKHNHDPWCDEIERISPELGLNIKAKPIRQKRVDGKVKWYVEPGHLKRIEIATWPYLIRPKEYYESSVRNLIQQVTP